MMYLKLFESFNEKFYHGNRKGDFPPKIKRFAGAIFMTNNLEFAKNFAGFDEPETFTEGAVFEIVLKPNIKLCNPMDKKTMIELELSSVIQKMIDDNYVDKTNGTKFTKISKGFKGYNIKKDEDFDISSEDESVYHYLWRVKNGAWRIIECEPIINQIKSKGYDGFFVIERGSKNVAIFDEKLIDNFKRIL
jgi:hypothetical protein